MNEKKGGKGLTCRIQSVDYLTHDVVQVSLKIQDNKVFQYLPGQFIDLMSHNLPLRSYSIANYTPRDHGLLEFHIRLFNGSEFGHVLFSESRETSVFQIKGPNGNSFLKEDSVNPVILIAGSTGFSAIKAIIEYVIATGVNREFYLYWGVKDESDLYSELPQQWDHKYENINFIPVLSEPNHHWKGKSGFVHESVLNDFDTLVDYEVYAFGPLPMVNSIMDTFFNHGLIKNNLFSDFF
jgi:CDP-4-dehydro-6-deoxyglucose reductase, E3